MFTVLCLIIRIPGFATLDFADKLIKSIFKNQTKNITTIHVQHNDTVNI